MNNELGKCTLNEKIIPNALRFIKSHRPPKFQVCRCYSYWALLLQPDFEEEEKELFVKLILHI